MAYVIRRIKHATDKDETEIELLNQPYNIKSNLNKEKIYWFTFIHISLTKIDKLKKVSIVKYIKL